jgi:ABC-2 type transport system ATP-binding protein
MEVTSSSAESTVRFQTGKREEELAGVLTALVSASVAVTQFREVQTDLEDAFMTVAKQAESEVGSSQGNAP